MREITLNQPLRLCRGQLAVRLANPLRPELNHSWNREQGGKAGPEPATGTRMNRQVCGQGRYRQRQKGRVEHVPPTELTAGEPQRDRDRAQGKSKRRPDGRFRGATHDQPQRRQYQQHGQNRGPDRRGDPVMDQPRPKAGSDCAVRLAGETECRQTCRQESPASGQLHRDGWCGHGRGGERHHDQIVRLPGGFLPPLDPGRRPGQQFARAHPGEAVEWVNDVEMP